MDLSSSAGGTAQRFLFPVRKDGKKIHYFCGNSLGLQPVSTRAFLDEVLGDWSAMAVDGHFAARHCWMEYPDLLSAPLAGLTGARAHEVRAMGTLTANLHLMLVSFFRPQGKRTKILMEAGSFPSDRYAVVSQLQFHGLSPAENLIEIAPREGESVLHTEDILAAISQHGGELALILFSGVQYLSGQVFDMQAISAAGRQAGACVGFDLAHAIGNVPLSLHDWGPDFAVWCSYKYLNAGPGAVAGIFVHERHAENRGLPRFAGWYGNEKQNRFLMEKDFAPAFGAEGWQLSNENVISLAALRAALTEFEQTDFQDLMKLQQKLVFEMEMVLMAYPAIEILTPASRGGQLSFRLRDGNSRQLFVHLQENGILGDFRSPNVLRLAIAPLYNTEEDLKALAKVLASYFS